jgi:hypothetical protein
MYMLRPVPTSTSVDVKWRVSPPPQPGPTTAIASGKAQVRHEVLGVRHVAAQHRRRLDIVTSLSFEWIE